MISTKIYFSILTFVALIITCSGRAAFPDLTDDNFENDCLLTHNNYRALHKDTPDLKIDTDAVTYAKSRCNLISQYEALSHGHDGLKGYGENLYWGGSSSNKSISCAEAIKSWYNEITLYNYNSPGFGSSTGHFTQVVWKSTTGVGCARCGGKGSQYYETYVVCNYSPPGNYANQFQQNVMPTIK